MYLNDLLFRFRTSVRIGLMKDGRRSGHAWPSRTDKILREIIFSRSVPGGPVGQFGGFSKRLTSIPLNSRLVLRDVINVNINTLRRINCTSTNYEYEYEYEHLLLLTGTDTVRQKIKIIASVVKSCLGRRRVFCLYFFLTKDLKKDYLIASYSLHDTEHSEIPCR